MRSRLNNEKGFTLVEIIAVLILMGILAAVAVPRYIDLTSNAETRAIEAAIAELNGRENMNWANVKLSTAGWTTDAATFALLLPEIDGTNGDLGTSYSWTSGPLITGGTLEFKSTSQNLTRDPSTTESPGFWH